MMLIFVKSNPVYWKGKLGPPNRELMYLGMRAETVVLGRSRAKPRSKPTSNSNIWRRPSQGKVGQFQCLRDCVQIAGYWLVVEE